MSKPSTASLVHRFDIVQKAIVSWPLALLLIFRVDIQALTTTSVLCRSLSTSLLEVIGSAPWSWWPETEGCISVESVSLPLMH